MSMVDVVALVVNHCRSEGLNVVAAVPSGSGRPVARVEESGVFSPSSQMPDHLYEYDLEVNVWAETKESAQELLGDINTCLRQQPATEHGVVTRSQMVGLSYEPDEDWPAGPEPGPRYIALLRVNAHP